MHTHRFINRITDIWDYPRLSIYHNEVDGNTKYFNFLDCESKSQDTRLYIHIPFCNSFCSFCQFYKEPYQAYQSKLDDYFERVKREIKYYADKIFFKNSKVTSIFFGGGDPSIIPSDKFTEIVEYIYQNFNIDQNVSFSVEGNIIYLLDERRLEAYKKNGVTRLSFGVQTFDESIRKKLHLKPTLSDIINVVSLIKKIGFKSFAFDLMYDLPDQTLEILNCDIDSAIGLGADYIDFYSLNLYPNTQFYSDVQDKKMFTIAPSKQREYEHNMFIHNKMISLGYRQVISCTYSKLYDKPHPGLYHFLHNGNMLGIGPSARSYLDGHSFRNFCSVEKYTKALDNYTLPVETGLILTAQEINRRQVIFDINLMKIPYTRAQQYIEEIEQLIALGYMVQNGDWIELTDEGTAWVGNIQKCFFSDAESSNDVINFLKAIKAGQSAYNQDYMSVRKANKKSSGK